MSTRSSWSDPGYEAVASLVRERTGLIFAHGMRRGVETRIQQSMAECSTPDPARYLERIASDQAAFDALVARLTIGETYFFREPAQLDFIRSEVVPALVRRRGAQHRVRAWSAGCASGEEAYSLAILLRELGLGRTATVVGTDLSHERLAQARAGVYSRWSLRGVAEETVRGYFRARGNRFELAEEVRSAVSFRYLNLADDAYPSPASGIWGMDLILCRNVLIYFDADTVAGVARRLMASLSEDGWLFLGASDPPLSELVPCEVVVTGAGVAYRRPRRGAASTRVVPSPAAKPAPEPEPAPAPREPVTPAAAAPRETPVRREAVPAPADERAAAEASYAARDYGRAAELAARALERDAGDVRAWTLRVRALANQGRLEEAGRACSAALDLHRTSAELTCLHAILLSAAGHHAEASAAARRALYLDREMVVAHLALGHALLRRGERAAARRALLNAERILTALPPEAIVPASDGESAASLLELARRQLRLTTEAA